MSQGAPAWFWYVMLAVVVIQGAPAWFWYVMLAVVVILWCAR